MQFAERPALPSGKESSHGTLRLCCLVTVGFVVEGIVCEESRTFGSCPSCGVASRSQPIAAFGDRSAALGTKRPALAHGTVGLLMDSSIAIDATRSAPMAGRRQAIELAMTEEEIGALTALSRSRTEPASRVSRAQMLLAYRENPSFCGVGKKLGAHHRALHRASADVRPVILGSSCVQARTGSEARLPRQAGAGHGVQDPWPRGNQAAQGALLSGTSRPLFARGWAWRPP